MKITIIDDYAEREAARKDAKSADAIKRRDDALRAKAEIEAEKDALLFAPSKPPRELPEGDSLVLADMFGVRSYLSSPVRRFVADDRRA